MPIALLPVPNHPLLHRPSSLSLTTRCCIISLRASPAYIINLMQLASGTMGRTTPSNLPGYAKFGPLFMLETLTIQEMPVYPTGGRSISITGSQSTVAIELKLAYQPLYSLTGSVTLSSSDIGTLASNSVALYTQWVKVVSSRSLAPVWPVVPACQSEPYLWPMQRLSEHRTKCHGQLECGLEEDLLENLLCQHCVHEFEQHQRRLELLELPEGHHHRARGEQRWCQDGWADRREALRAPPLDLLFTG